MEDTRDLKARCFDLIKQAEAHQVAIREIQAEITRINKLVEYAEKREADRESISDREPDQD